MRGMTGTMLLEGRPDPAVGRTVFGNTAVCGNAYIWFTLFAEIGGLMQGCPDHKPQVANWS